ncbi:hydrogen peroxide-inducible genes activator [Bacteroides sp. 519]|uniref:hydrogen peroxide-inducible genes activator n=1 Tax=Bacteroides sp. 519 TaxID=2302937 RepID=UPI0013D7618C|nr:hydrogen peroxide-inducible genes activator [Bacteroides sp. 519]NDV59722.1 hydrogen peroxide-inducible genes activator [Bacteroides sp. 519]
MTIQQLEYILAVDKYRHFAKAAEHCGVTQPTLSAMVQKLEDELGVKLFDRHIQPVTPTAIGIKILKQAKQIQLQVSQVKEIVYEEKNTLSGVLRLAVLPTIAPYLLPRFFPQLVNSHPEIDIRVMEKQTHEIERGLLSDEIDAAITATHPEDLNLKEEFLFYEEFFGYVSKKELVFKNELIKTSEVNTNHLWLLDKGHCFRDQLVRYCQQESVKLNQIRYNLGSLETFMRMVESGHGITFIPELATKQLNVDQQAFVRPFAIPKPTREIRIIYHRNYVRNSLLDILKNAIQTSVPKEMLLLRAGQALV